jgi:hypothetical protein
LKAVTENDIKRIVAETLAKVGSEIHSTTTTTQTQSSPKRNGRYLLSWLIPLICSVVLAVVGWTLYMGERTSDAAHSTLKTSIESEAKERAVGEAAMTKQLDLFTTLVAGMRDDIATLKAQMNILLAKK